MRDKTGLAPWLADWGLLECPEGETEPERYSARRQACVRDADVVVIFGDLTTPGSRGLVHDCELAGKPWVHVRPAVTTPRQVAEFLQVARVEVLMVAGNRESRDPGIG